MKRRMVQCGKNGDMMRRSRAGKRTGNMTGTKTGKRTGGAARAVWAFCAALSLTACAGGNPAAGQGGEDISAGQGVSSGQDADWLAERTKRDRRTNQDQITEPQDEDKVTRISLDDLDGRIILAEGGDIWLSGRLDGQVVIEAEEDELVHLYLAGVEITSLNGPAIQIREAAKTIVTLVSDAENVLADSPDYTDCEDTPACLYSACDLTVNGDGALRVFGYHEDGVRSKDRIKILGGTVAVQAKGDGIRGNDGIYIKNATVAVESEKNGLRTVNQGADDRGVIEIDGGAVSVVAGKSGICAAADLYLYHGTCSVNAVGESVRTEGCAYITEGCMED